VGKLGRYVVTKAKPFLKWAGGRRQLLATINGRFPLQLPQGQIRRYIEPFVGGGAVFFHIAGRYPVAEFYLSDINLELILAYRTVQQDVDALIARLAGLEAAFLSLKTADQEPFYYEIRHRFNQQRHTIDYEQYSPNWVQRTAWLIFLNRTGYNGLFRVNSSGGYNVPFGRYKRPKICYPKRLTAVSQTLQNVTIRQGSYRQWAGCADERTFVYFDPPYRPLSATASFNSYSRHPFDDKAQLDLAAFFRQLDGQGAKLMLSNSDPKNVDPADDFFDNAYNGYTIERIPATRQINSKSDRRGAINELLITNY
jgi:DNA adenine methylase